MVTLSRNSGIYKRRYYGLRLYQQSLSYTVVNFRVIFEWSNNKNSLRRIFIILLYITHLGNSSSADTAILLYSTKDDTNL